MRAGLLVTVVALASVGQAAAQGRTVSQRFAVAIESGDLAAVKTLVEGGQAPDTPIDYGGYTLTPLMKAAHDGRTDIARYLLAKGANVNARSSQGETALTEAAIKGWTDMTELLLKAGADVKADARGSTALDLALFNGRLDVAEQLVQAGSDVNRAGPHGITPLLTAANVCNPDALRFLAAKGARLDLVTQLDSGGSTALTTAAGSGQVDCVRTLLELGANPALKMKDGGTALSNAEASGNAEAVSLIKAALAKAPAKKVRRPGA